MFGSPEAFVTVGAGVRPLAGVCEDVTFEMLLPTKHLVTIFTSVNQIVEKLPFAIQTRFFLCYKTDSGRSKARESKMII